MGDMHELSIDVFFIANALLLLLLFVKVEEAEECDVVGTNAELFTPPFDDDNAVPCVAA